VRLEIDLLARVLADVADIEVAGQRILGGSGKYAGASGWCVTEHLPDGTWRHTFHLIGISASTSACSLRSMS
jgi:hypothetical protein